ncbi:MAG: tandem-95 repeat protein, partial [Rhizobiaceae bacterium]
MREETSQIPGVVSAPLQNAPQGSGMVYTVPGNSTAYGWKLAPGSSGILWTDSNYSVLPEAVIIEFDDVAIELGADGETRTRFHGETTYSAPESVAVDFKEVVVEGFDQDSVGDTVELENQLIPNQLDEMGAEISFDIGSFLTENMMDADCSLELHGMPSGLVYNPARMRVEGTISDDAPTGHPHHVTIIINVGNGKSIKSGFSWTVRDVKAVDQNSVNTMVVPSLNNNDDASSAAVLFSVAASMSLASRGFSLAKSGNDLGGDGKPQAANGNGLLQFSPLAGAGGESVLTGGEDDDLINLNAASGVPISREDDDENSLPSEFTAPTAQLSRGGDDESPQQNAQPSLSKDDVRGAEEVNAAAENGSQNQNTAPYAAPPPATTALEETLRTDIDVLSYAFDLDQDILRVVEASAQHGSVTVTAEGKLNYQPDNLFNGIDIISYTLDDGNGGRSSTSFEIDVLPLNDAPVVGNIIPQNTTEDVAIGSINVLSSAIDVDGDTLSVQAGSVNALHGSVNINGDGTLNYTPNSDYFGSDTISYTIDDGSGGSNATASGFVNVTVTAVNDAPTAGTPNAEMMNEDGLLANINVLNFAADIDGDLVSITPGSASSLNGNVTVNGDGTLNYIPNANFNGLDTISYTVEDGNGGSSVGSVTVNIGAVNDVPITNTVGPFTTNEDNVLNSIDVLSAASDIDGDALSVANGSVSALNGAVTINADNTLNYTPNSDYFGSDTISYTIEDGHGGNVAATIDVTVNSVNDIPLSGTPNTQTTDEDTALTSIDVLSFSSDLDGDVVSVISGSVSAANGSVAINGDGTLNYTPNANFNGSDTISYSVEDGNGGTAVGSVAVNVNTINDAPLAGSVGAQATTENTALNNILVLPSASDVDGDTLSIVAGSGSALNGVVSINGDGTLNYTPNINFNGSDTVSYSVTDGNGGVVVGTVDIAVASVNNTPIAGLPSAQTTNEDVALNNINVLSAASDIDGDTLTVQAGSASALNGAVSINGDGTLNYTPNADYFGSDTISYTVDDGNGGTAAGSISVTVNSVNDAPTALAGLGGGSDEDNGHAYSVVGFGSDIDGTIDPATVQLVGT